MTLYKLCLLILPIIIWAVPSKEPTNNFITDYENFIKINCCDYITYIKKEIFLQGNI